MTLTITLRPPSGRTLVTMRRSAEPVTGADAANLTAKAIDNSLDDKLAKSGFIEKTFIKSGR